MEKCKMICPDCGAIVITASPEAFAWELCPSCRRHIWDAYDLMMGEVQTKERTAAGRTSGKMC